MVFKGCILRPKRRAKGSLAVRDDSKGSEGAPKGDPSATLRAKDDTTPGAPPFYPEFRTINNYNTTINVLLPYITTHPYALRLRVLTNN